MNLKNSKETQEDTETDEIIDKPENPNDFGELTEEEDIYKENILDHYRHPHNSGELKKYTFKHKELNPLCGDEVEIYVKLDAENKVSEVSFIGRGCAISQASASMLTDYVKSKRIEELRSLKRDVILDMLGIRIGVVRMKCAMLSLKTLLKGIDETEIK